MAYEGPRGGNPSEVYVDKDAMRDFISKIVSIAQVTKEIPDFLDGQNGQKHSVWVTRRDLGDVGAFYGEYTRLLSWRENEAEHLDAALWMTARKLAWGLAKLTNTDVEAAGEMANVEDGLKDRVSDHGLRPETGVGRDAVRGTPGAPPPSEARDERLARNQPEA
ncbi:MAG: hypothetical protein ACRDJ9_09740 [Dehalococcoidia bacterium]